jgi:hypothetical protein
MVNPFPVNRKTLEVADYHKLWGACRRYDDIFGPSSLLGDQIPETTIPGRRGLTPWLIEAPLNSVELLEAVLKPAEPFKIYKAHHVSRPPPITDTPPKPVKKDDLPEIEAFWYEAGYQFQIDCRQVRKQLCEEFQRGQGRLTRNREVSFVCLEPAAMDTMYKDFLLTYHAVRLNWIAIPWNTGGGRRTILVHPWALVLRRQPTPDYSYWDSFQRMLKERGLAGLAESGFPRSLLQQGTVPLPETLRDWLMGIPGETAALPYFAPTAEEYSQAKSRQHQLVLR